MREGGRPVEAIRRSFLSALEASAVEWVSTAASALPWSDAARDCEGTGVGSAAAREGNGRWKYSASSAWNASRSGVELAVVLHDDMSSLPKSKVEFALALDDMPRATFGIGAPTSRSRSHNRQAPDLEAGPILEEQTEGADERTALLPDTPVRRPARIGSLYNIANGQSSNGQGSPHYLTLNQEQERLRHEEDEGRRSESILKLSGLIDDRGGEFERFRMSEEDMKGMSRKVKEFYRHQNTILVSPIVSDDRGCTADASAGRIPRGRRDPGQYAGDGHDRRSAA